MHCKCNQCTWCTRCAASVPGALGALGALQVYSVHSVHSVRCKCTRCASALQVRALGALQVHSVHSVLSVHSVHPLSRIFVNLHFALIYVNRNIYVNIYVNWLGTYFFTLQPKIQHFLFLRIYFQGFLLCLLEVLGCTGSEIYLRHAKNLLLSTITC